MKSIIPPSLRSAAAVLALILWMPAGSGILRGQDESENNTTFSTTYDSTGVVKAISAPLTMTVDDHEGPFTYQIDPDVHVYKADNKTGGLGDVHVGQRVTVYYFKRLGQETVARVVILQSEKAAK